MEKIMKNTKSSRKGLTLKQKEAVTGLIFISLPLLSLIIMMYYPIIRSFFISFFEWNLLQKPKFIGIENYKTLIHDEVFKQALTNTSNGLLFMCRCQRLLLSF